MLRLRRWIEIAELRIEGRRFLWIVPWSWITPYPDLAITRADQNQRMVPPNGRRIAPVQVKGQSCLVKLRLGALRTA